jgi:hypothetical protein
MTRTILILVAALAGCGGNSGGGQCGGGGVVLGGGGGGNSNCAVDGPTSSNVQYQAFTPKTSSIGDANGVYQLALSDGTGGTACGLSSDQRNSLGQAGHEILANIAYNSGGYPCLPGTYSFTADCPADPGPQPSVPQQCAYYRPFDATGHSMGFLPATAGSVTISGDNVACTFTLNLSFSGTQFNDTFTLVNNNTGAMPWCAP